MADEGDSMAQRLRAAGALGFLLAAVAVAFADSSVVVLALPDLLDEFHVSIGSVAWVVTSYNLVLALGALALARVAPRFEAARMAFLGAGIFLVSSLACALAPSIWVLFASRGLQGLGAALLLVGALPVSRALASTPIRGTALWTAAGVFGAALGPALGGALTEGFDWRAIFVAQVPVAALALVVVRRAPGRGDAAVVVGESGSRRARRAAGIALALASAALVGLLFLAVVQLVDVWRLSPLRAAGVVSVIPLAALAAAPFAASARAAVVAAGAVLLAGGLVGMAFVPGRELAWVVAALTVAGLGYGLLVPGVARTALTGEGSPAARGALALALRHLGLVAGLLVLTPVLAGDLAAAGDRAQLRGVSVILDSPVPVSSKLRVAIDLAPVLGSPPSGGLPDFTEALRSEPSPVAGLGSDLDRTVAATVTRGFRRTFVLAAIFALLAVLPVALISRRRGAPSSAAFRPAAAALLVGAALVSAELFGGAVSYGERPQLVRPCAHRTQSNLQAEDAKGQRILLEGLDLVACRLHESREQLVVNAARHGVDAAHFAARLERLIQIAGHVPAFVHVG